MGARTQRGGKRPRGSVAVAAAKRRRRYNKEQQEQQQQQQRQQQATTAAAEQDANGAVRLPACVQQLYTAQSCAALTDACADIAVFALQSTHHTQFVRAGVVARLAHLLLRARDKPATRQTQQAEQQSCDDAEVHETTNEDDGDSDADALLNMRTAAAEALRNLITNSRNDEVVDMLMAVSDKDTDEEENNEKGDAAMAAAHDMAMAEGSDMARALCAACTATWSDVHAAVAARTAAAVTVTHHDDDDDTAHMTTLLRYAMELLQLVSVCVEGSDVCADAFSSPDVVHALLALLELAYTTAMQHALAQQQQQQDSGSGSGKPTSHMHDAPLMAAVCVAASDVLAVLSSDNAALTRVLCEGNGSGSGSSNNKAQHLLAFLDRIVAADAALQWLSALQRDGSVDDIIAHLLLQQQQQQREQHGDDDNEEGDEQAAEGGVRSAAAALTRIERERVWCQLLQTTLSVQTTLLHVAATIVSARRVLSLLTHTLRVWQPMAVWRRVLSLLTRDCALDEATRSAAVALHTHRLRCVHVAVRLLHAVVAVVCEDNATGEDDEVAFAANAHSALLREQHTLAVFAEVLKDVLWVQQQQQQHNSSESSSSNATTVVDVVQQQRQQQQQQQEALRGATSSNAEVTTLQFLVLGVEVAVWDVANVLLVMVPVQQLGDAALIWRAMVTALQHRYNLLVEAAAAAAAAVATAAVGNAHATNNNTNNDDAVAAAAHSIAVQSAAARQLLWLQAEALTQMLWTLQRKQSRACGGALQLRNTLAAAASDVDLLTRLSWEHAATPTLRQACVGAVGLLCCSLCSAEATTVAARYARALLLASSVSTHLANNSNNNNSNSALLDLVVCDTAPPRPPSARCRSGGGAATAAAWAAWRQRLAAADALTSVRCEAANTLIDLFLDERYDASVYVPLRVHAALRLFLSQLQQYMTRRARLTRRCAQQQQQQQQHKHKHGKSADADEDDDVAADATAALQWDEVASNLEAFLAYKEQHNAGSSRA